MTVRTVVLAIAVTSIGVWMFPRIAAAETPRPAAPAAKPEQATPPKVPAEPAGTPAASGSPGTPASSKSRSQCDRDVGVLAGRDKDRTLLKQPDVRALAARAPDLV